jgi:gliding motility-associated-like protein
LKNLLILLFLFLGIAGKSIAQNLVKNPSFENYTECPDVLNFENNVTDWYCLYSASYYFNSCDIPQDFGVPINLYGNQSAHTGDAYMSVLAYYMDYSSDFKGYIEGGFSGTLIKDSIYCVSYYVNLIDIAFGAIVNLDAFISDGLVDYPPNTVGEHYTLQLPAQIRSQQLLNDSINWTRISGLYKAHGGESYITIGNFTLRENTTKVYFYPPIDLYIHYYIDDVSVALAGVGLRSPDLGNDTVICRSALPLPLAAPIGYDDYLWSNGATTRETEATGQGKYWVKCIINGCGELFDEKIISFDTPLLDLGKDTVICKGEDIIVPAQPGFSQYLWSTGDTTQNIKVSTEGIYSLQTLDRCGIQTDAIKVSVDTIPAGIIDLGYDTTMCLYGEDMPVVLTANIQLPNYTWNTGDTTWQITVTERGMYNLRSQFRCGVVSDSIFVDECPPTIFCPNAFTPDNDGVNDVFRAIVVNTQIKLMIIYNRWGQKIYESNDPFPEWDGTCYSQPAPVGLYAYLVYFSDAQSGFKQKQKRGTVMLVR